MKRVEIVELETAGCDEAWQAFVNLAPRGSLYHGLEWRDILLRTFGHRSCYLLARDGGAMRGVLPLIEMRSLLFGHCFVSLPFLDYAGILADTPGCEAALASAAVALAENRGAQYIELRQPSAIEAPAHAGWTLRQHKAALVLPLDPDPGVHWAGLSSRLRGKVRKAEHSGAVFSVGGIECLDDFYHVFALNMRNLGTPTYSRALFWNVLQFANEATLLLVRREGRPVAGALALRRGDKVELPWICSNYSHSRFNVNEYLYWRVIEWACRSNARVLDFGRSTLGSGACRFKMQWNPSVCPLSWYCWMRPGAAAPDLDPNSPKFALPVRLWKHMPLSLANWGGPWIARSIP